MIHYHTHELLLKYLKSGDFVIQFGNNGMNLNEQVQSSNNPDGSVKGTLAVDYYAKHHGAETLSIDRNGHDKSLKMDLSKLSKNEDLQGKADIVTDFGTIEHIKNLKNALQNAFNFCKVGGLLIHANPLRGHFPNHNSYHYFTPDFWKEYAKAAKMEPIVELRIEAAYNNTATGKEVFAVLRKTAKSKFPTKAAFDKIAAAHVFPK